MTVNERVELEALRAEVPMLRRANDHLALQLIFAMSLVDADVPVLDRLQRAEAARDVYKQIIDCYRQLDEARRLFDEREAEAREAHGA